jgi:TPR repeat protein
MRNWVSLFLFVFTLYSFGQSPTQHNPTVADLLQGASKGNVRAELMLGLAYEFGRGVAQDFVAAAHWYGKAAAAGDSHAQALL